MSALFKIVVAAFRALVFVALFGLAIKNSGPMELRFFFDQMWVAPVSAVILVVFFVGVTVGLTVALSVRLGPRIAPKLDSKARDGN